MLYTGQQLVWKKAEKPGFIWMNGENSQITYFCKLYCNLPLFWKYLANYHSFSTRASWNRVLNSTGVLKTQVPIEFAKGAVAKLEFCILKMPPWTRCT